MKRAAHNAPYRSPPRTRGVVTPWGIAWIDDVDAVEPATDRAARHGSYFHFLVARSELSDPEG
jgi:hypothetical protein